MSARLEAPPRDETGCRRMDADDVDAVIAIENRLYEFPWTRGNFSDSLNAGYQCWVMEQEGRVAGYLVLARGSGEAHVLNISIAADWQGRGLGSALLEFAADLARAVGDERILLEVRVSNLRAQQLYARRGFREIARRRDYYPARGAREDAVIMERAP